MPRRAERFYWDVVRDAWHIAWHHKHLWFFGFFAALLGFGSGADLFLHVYDVNSAVVPAALAGHLASALPGATTFKVIVLASPFPALTLVILAGVAALAIGMFAWLTTVSVAALVHAVKSIAGGKDVHLVEGVRVGHEKFWTVLAINIATKLVLLGAIAITSLSLFVLARDGSPVSAVFYLLTYLAFSGIALIASVTGIFAVNAATAKTMTFTRAVLSGWKLFKNHWVSSLEMVGVLLAASIGIALVAVLLVLALFIPILVVFTFAAFFHSASGVGTLSLISALVLVASAVTLGSFLATFQAAAWTLLWKRLSDGEWRSLLSRAKMKLKKSFGK